jgi:translation elongation factor EF-G
MQEFFDQGTLPVHDLKMGLREAVLAKRLFPVLLSSALHNIGSDAMLNFLVEIFPSPAARGRVVCHKTADHKGETIERAISDSAIRFRFLRLRRWRIPSRGALRISR